ncbi:hypothetical protein JTE90_022389 [Oedothorax gibbosus]|uniref:Protein arginine N-methyltransferase domain-containing protein n=1 Tax=Oedothorax gibbosus TaxID=931172 RepID=A0AAV6UP25_9ARAC|nr:hypothetical protein JTE90_022389 [Oedothorax gibbosus]
MDGTSEDWSQGRQLLLQRCKGRALLCLHEREYGRAFAHFIVALTVQPSVRGELLNAFLFTLDKLVEKMEKEKQVNEILMCYEQALEVLPQDSHVLHGLATTLFRLGYVESSLSYFLRSYKANPFFTPSLYCMENLKNALVERWHFKMLNDMTRNLAYKRAIERAVGEGYRHVLDIGAGTGILSMMAADANAEKVYACEASEILFAVLQNVIQVNDKSVQAFQKLSTDLQIPEDLPEKVTLIVTEIFDAGLLGENSLETLNHAWNHLLLEKVGTSPENENERLSLATNQNSVAVVKVIPQSADVFVVPIECERFRKYFRLDNTVKKELDIKQDIIPEFLDEEPYSTEKITNLPCEYKYLSKPTSLLQANFNSPEEIKNLLQGKVFSPTFTCCESGTLDAFVMWFDLHLDDHETVSSAPSKDNEGCCWEQAIFYVFPQSLGGASPFCSSGDTIEADFLCKGHLTLQKVKLSTPPSEPSPSQFITMDPSLIHLLNSYVSEGVINLNLKDLTSMNNASILDISTFPVIGLKSVRNTSSSLTVLRTQYQAEVEQFRDMYGVQEDKLLFRSYEDFCNAKMQCDVLVVDPVEMCGLLKKNLLEDVTMLRMQCLKDTGIVVPGELEIHAVLVDSQVLRENSKLVSDDRVNGYKISQIMNAYKCHIHQDIQFSTLVHQKMTSPFKLSHFDLNNTSETGSTRSHFKDSHKTLEVEVTSTGKVTAIVYWFTMKYNPGCVVDTSSPEGLWKQAACILDHEVDVREGEKVRLQYGLKNSCFQIGVLDH